MNKLYLFLALAGLAACTTKELPVPKRAESTHQISLGADYGYQVFYSLTEDREVSRNERTNWDLALEAATDGYHIYLNSSKLMYAWNTDQQDFDAVTDTIGFGAGKKMDAANGYADSTAIGDWRGAHPVYIIDRGITAEGAYGMVKIQVTEVTETQYTLSFQDLSGGEKHTLNLQKDPLYNSVFLSFNEGGKSVSVEPPKDKWDICFTQYSVEIPIPYMVTGVLTNRYQTLAAIDSSLGFEAIDLAFAQQVDFTNAIDVIGYDWKSFDLNTGLYQVDIAKNYIVKTSEGFYFKLHFVDFYNDQGEKGYPKWVAQRL